MYSIRYVTLIQEESKIYLASTVSHSQRQIQMSRCAIQKVDRNDCSQNLQHSETFYGVPESM